MPRPLSSLSPHPPSHRPNSCPRSGSTPESGSAPGLAPLLLQLATGNASRLQAPPHLQRFTHALWAGASSGASEGGLEPPLTQTTPANEQRPSWSPGARSAPGLRSVPAFHTGILGARATPPSGPLPFKGSKSGWRARPGRGPRRVPPRACPSAGAARDSARRETARDGQVGPRRAKAGGGMTVFSDGAQSGGWGPGSTKRGRKGASWITSMFNS